MWCDLDLEMGSRFKATCAVSYTFEGQERHLVLCDECTDRAFEDDPSAWLRLLEPGEKRADVWR